MNNQIKCLVDIREVVGDPLGKLMQDELVEKIRNDFSILRRMTKSAEYAVSDMLAFIDSMQNFKGWVKEYRNGFHYDNNAFENLHEALTELKACFEHQREQAVKPSIVVLPYRIQRKRTKGWKMPPDTVLVCRPGKFGNPFKPDDCRKAGYEGTDLQIKQFCVEAFRSWLVEDYGNSFWQGDESDRRRSAILDDLGSLRGKNLACFCSLDEPCHADVLLKLANRESE